MEISKFRKGPVRIMISKRIVAVVSITLLGCVGLVSAANDARKVNKLVIHAEQGKETISRNIYGHFSEHLGRCIYEGFWVGEDSPIPNTRGIRKDVVKALKKIKVPVLRWPGGCFADTYHWKDGIGPRKSRPCMVNIHWGGVTENNHFGTHEFMDLCEQLGCEPYICVNVGSGTVQEAAEWVEYITFDGKSQMADLRRKNGRDKAWKVKYWGVGNESGGCGGRMRPEYYADLYRRYATYLRNFSGNKVFKIACGEGLSWTEVLMPLMPNAGEELMDGLSAHHYCEVREESGDATRFEEVDWFTLLRRALRMEKYVEETIAIMDKYDPEKRVGLIVDEWGACHGVEPGTNPAFLYQQNTLRDALVAGLTLNIFNNHCDGVKMANIAQTVNVLQAMILTKGEKMILTPTYHVFEMYKVHQDATLLPVELECNDYQFGDERIPALNVSASRDKSGKIHISLCNLDPRKRAELVCEFRGAKAKIVSGRVLTARAMNAHNTFDKPEAIYPVEFGDVKLKGNGFTATLPAKSVVVLEIE